MIRSAGDVRTESREATSAAYPWMILSTRTCLAEVPTTEMFQRLWTRKWRTSARSLPSVVTLVSKRVTLSRAQSLILRLPYIWKISLTAIAQRRTTVQPRLTWSVDFENLHHHMILSKLITVGLLILCESQNVSRLFSGLYSRAC
jgi:hypothetical protein